jgi:hypothetical protein
MGTLAAKFAVTSRAASIFTTHAAVGPPVHAPLQPVKVARGSDWASSVTQEPAAKLCEQSLGHSIPGPVTCPGPLTETERGC